MNTIHGTRWAVTGAAGLIGRALRLALAGKEVELVSTDVRPVSTTGPHDRTEVVDLADLERLTALFDGCAGVIHLGGISDEADFHDLAAVNIVGTYHVLEAARRAGVPRVVFASSNRTTGMYPTGQIVAADMPTRPDGFYGVSKVAGEALCRLYADKFGISAIAVRIGSYGNAPGSPREQRTWLSPDDMVRAFVAAMTTEKHVGVFYAVSANENLWWDLSSAAEIGYAPLDDAADFGAAETIDPETAQGGPYATVEFSLTRMRQ